MAVSNRRFSLAAVALPLLLVATTGMAHAAVLAVNNTSDTAVAGDGSLRGEILAASAGDTIVFAAGVTGTITLLPANGPLTITKSATITDRPARRASRSMVAAARK